MGYTYIFKVFDAYLQFKSNWVSVLYFYLLNTGQTPMGYLTAPCIPGPVGFSFV